MIIYQPYSYSPTVNPFRKRVTQFGLVLLTVLAVCLMIFLFNAGKGYRIITIGDNEYAIKTTLTRTRALEISQKNRLKGNYTVILHDIRLPNGVLTVSYINSESLTAFIESEQEEITITNRWSYESVLTPISDKATNSIEVGVEFTYREIQDTLNDPDRLERRFPLERNTTLPNGKTVTCGLSIDELEIYRRRMHCLGADKIVVPFYFSLDGIKPPIGVYRIL